MRYVCCHRFKALDLNGKYINLPYGSQLEQHERYIVTPNGRPICFVKSMTAHKFFAANDDGDGLMRGELTHKLAFAPRKTSEGFRYTRKEREKLLGKWSKYIRQDVDMLLFNHDFFGAPLKDLIEMTNDIKEMSEE